MSLFSSGNKLFGCDLAAFVSSRGAAFGAAGPLPNVGGRALLKITMNRAADGYWLVIARVIHARIVVSLIMYSASASNKLFCRELSGTIAFLAGYC
jgi:hypothetical protein